MRDHRLVDVDRALRRAGGAAGEVQQRRVLGIGRRESRIRRSRSAISARKSSVPGGGRSPSASPTSRTCSRPGSDAADRRDLAAVQRRASSPAPAPSPMVEPLRGSARARTRRTAGRTTLPFFSAPSAATYSSGMRPARTKTRSPLPTPSRRSTLAKRLVSAAQLGVGEIARLRRRLPSQRSASCCARGAARVAVDRLVGDVEPAPPGSPSSSRARRVPGELPPALRS